jgi:hypothetical protein
MILLLPELLALYIAPGIFGAMEPWGQEPGQSEATAGPEAGVDSESVDATDPTGSETAKEPTILNPYFHDAEWRVWRDDQTPIPDVKSEVRVDKKEKVVPVELAALELAKRMYPVPPPEAGAEGPYVVYQTSPKASLLYAGIWDDVYASWSNLHGYVRTKWMGPDGSQVAIRDQIIDFVNVEKHKVVELGVNFLHQSTTGMAHTITNGYIVEMTTSYEKIYFGDCLVTSPAHSSITDLQDDRSADLYIAHVPTLFNSVGSSNSETMAITKMIIAGGYLPPATKLLLKRNGLYPAAMLYLWKASLPYDQPYDHELRHRVAYKSVGNRESYPEKYSAAGINKGDKSLPYHQYDDLAHMKNMIDLARSMDVAMPEAIFNVENKGAGTLRYALKKAAVVIQEKDQDVEVQVSTAGCYDLQGLPLKTRWKLLYGNKETTVEVDPDDPTQFTIRVPWDDALPEGRTAIAFIANNGRFDSNPAILTVYRKKSDLPPNGGGYGDYKFPLTFSNQRPVLLDLQDQAVRPGKELRIELRAIDPEGFPISYYKRAGEIGELDGNIFVWKCPRKEPEGGRTVTIIASDGTSGNSYAGKQVSIYVGKPKWMAQITADKLTGPAPLKVKFTGKASAGRNSKTKFGWEVRAANSKEKAKEFKDLEIKREFVHTFEEPGLYTVEMTMKGSETDSETVQVWVTDGKVAKAKAALRIEGNGVHIHDGDETPSAFDHTDYGLIKVGQERERTFQILNQSSSTIKFDTKNPLKLSGEQAKDFKITRLASKKLGSGDSTTVTIRFRPLGPGPRNAQVILGNGSKRSVFTIAGVGE